MGEIFFASPLLGLLDGTASLNQSRPKSGHLNGQWWIGQYLGHHFDIFFDKFREATNPSTRKASVFPNNVRINKIK